MDARDEPTEPGPPIRVVLDGVPPVLARQLARLIAAQPDMVLVGELDDRVALLLAAATADVAVLGAAHASPPPGIVSHLLNEYPHLRIVVLASAGDAATLYWLGLRRRTVSAPSGDGIVAGIRRVHRLNPTV